jgi:hypothetical protein
MAKTRKYKKPQFTTMDYVRASRKGSREAAQEISNGFVSTHKVHQSKKAYNRRDNKIIPFE